MHFGDLDKYLLKLFVLTIFAGIIIGVVFSLGLPILWDWLKPLIHVATS